MGYLLQDGEGENAKSINYGAILVRESTGICISLVLLVLASHHMNPSVGKCKFFRQIFAGKASLPTRATALIAASKQSTG
jgi:hypothetical protein